MAVEKETAEKRAAELEEKLNSLREERDDRRAKLEEELNSLRKERDDRRVKLEEELNSLRKEREDRRVEEEAATRVLASRLRSVAEGLSSESSLFFECLLEL